MTVSSFDLVADKTLLLRRVGLFQGRTLAWRMTFHAGSVCRYVFMKIISWDERNFFSRRKKEEYEQYCDGNGEKEHVLFHG